MSKVYVESDQWQFDVRGIFHDLDCYQIDIQNRASFKRISITIDFERETISGAFLADDEWHSLTVEECLEYIEIIDKPIRNFDHIIEKNTKTYKVQVEEILERVVEIKAVSEQQAIYEVTNQYIDQEIVLDSEDIVSEDITIYHDR